MKEENKRLLFLDVAKFIGIALMIYAHARERGPEIMYIYSFHMPLFFIISGITFKIKDNETTGDFLIRKIKNLILPFLVLSFLLIIVDMCFASASGQVVDFKFFLNKLSYVFQNPRPYPLWFVLALFFSEIWLYIFIKLSFKKDYLVFLYSLLFLVAILLIYNYQSFKLAHAFDVSFVGVFFVTIGYLFSREWNKKPRDFILNNRLISLAVGGVLFGLFCLIVYLMYKQDPNNMKQLDMWANYYKPSFIRIPLAVLGSFGFIFICNFISNKPMAYLGRHTLVILAFQQNLSIKLFETAIAKEWYNSLKPLKINDPSAVLFTLVCTLFSLAILIPLSILLTETHCSYIFMKKPSKWYLALIDKLKKKKTIDVDMTKN